MSYHHFSTFERGWLQELLSLWKIKSCSSCNQDKEGVECGIDKLIGHKANAHANQHEHPPYEQFFVKDIKISGSYEVL